MAKYMVLYRSSMSTAEQIGGATPEQMKEGMDAWMAWFGKAGSSIVDFGAPLGPIGAVGPSSKDTSPVSGFSILEADSPEAVLSVLEEHPHLMTPGETYIEVLEYLPMPGM